MAFRALYRTSCPLRFAPSRAYMPQHLWAQKKKMEETRPQRPKTPFHERKHKPKFMMQMLKWEEQQRLQKEYPKEIEEFFAGDKIAVHKLISLASDKVEILRGLVLERRNTDMVNDSVLMINYHINTLYEMQIPIWSPFIKKIEVVEAGPRQRRHYRELRKLHPEDIAVHGESVFYDAKEVPNTKVRKKTKGKY